MIDRRQLTYSSSIAIGRFTVKPPRLEACQANSHLTLAYWRFGFQGKKKRLGPINAIVHQAIERHKKANLLDTLYATCAIPRVGG